MSQARAGGGELRRSRCHPILRAITFICRPRLCGVLRFLYFCLQSIEMALAVLMRPWFHGN